MKLKDESAATRSDEAHDLHGNKVVPVPEWAKNWFNGKVASGLSIGSLARYSVNLKMVNIDLSKSSVPEIRSRLAECASHYSLATLRHFTITIKQILKDLGRKDDADALKLPKHPEPRTVVYPANEIELLIKACENSNYPLRDRVLIRLLSEIGARRGELYNMRIKDVQFDEYSAIVWLHGKTGTRQRRVYEGQGDLLHYLKVHPNREDPNAKFWLNRYDRPLGYQGVYKLVRRIGLRANRHVYPHGFRHTAATRDVKSYTDREMMIRYGWNRPEMVGVYAHLSARDVDDKDLALHGLKNEQGRQCLNCNQKNPSTATYCMKCGQILPHAAAD